MKSTECHIIASRLPLSVIGVRAVDIDTTGPQKPKRSRAAVDGREGWL